MMTVSELAKEVARITGQIERMEDNPDEGIFCTGCGEVVKRNTAHIAMRAVPGHN